MAAYLKAYTAILAGGIGSRFWPASTPDRPKQFLPLASPDRLIDETIERATRLVGASRVRVVASARLVELMGKSLDAAGVKAFVEPQPRGTGPALAWAAHEIERQDPGAVMISMHSDHRIAPFEGLRDTLEEAVIRARAGYLCCVGVRPQRAETGYGYVELGDTLGPGSHTVRRFVEKPDAGTARSYVDSGRFLWNTGIFIWQCTDLLAAVEAHAEELESALPYLSEGDVSGFFEHSSPVAIEVGVMERAERVAVVEARFEWDDLGVWPALARSRGTDAQGNTVVGRARTHGAQDNIVWTETTRANLIGVSDLLVVEANGELLVMPADRAADLRALVRGLDDPPPPNAEDASTEDDASTLEEGEDRQ